MVVVSDGEPAGLGDTTMNATTAFDLTVLDRFTVDGTEYVAYDDGYFTDIIPASEFDAEAAEGTTADKWAQSTHAADLAIYHYFADLRGQGFDSGAHAVIRPAAERADS